MEHARKRRSGKRVWKECGKRVEERVDIEKRSKKPIEQRKSDEKKRTWSEEPRRERARNQVQKLKRRLKGNKKESEV